MALTGLGSWNAITPEYFTSAMASGAKLGLSARSQDEEEQSAADRLKLAYDQLGAKEQMASELAQAKQAQAEAALALRAQQLDSLNEYRQQVLENQRKHLEGGAASIVTHPEVPGMQFLRNPSGSETPVVRPAKDMSEGERLRLALEAQNQMKLGSQELATDPSYQSRTNLAGQVLSKVMPKQEAKQEAPPVKDDTLVEVTNPSGKRVRIRKSQLEDALKQGYKQ